jgi:hypothetical protein
MFSLLSMSASANSAVSFTLSFMRSRAVGMRLFKLLSFTENTSVVLRHMSILTVLALIPWKANAQYSICLDLFTLPAFPSAKTVPHLSVDKELMVELVKNKRFPLLPNGVDAAGNKVGWFISHSMLGDPYIVRIAKSIEGKIISMTYEALTEANERKYYKQAANFLEPFEAEIRLPRKGQRILHIDPSVQVKLIEKHGLTPQDVLEILRHVPANVIYVDDIAHRSRMVDSFYFYIPTGERTPLRVAIIFDKNKYFLATAYYPDTYKAGRHY